ncbi:MAG: gamma-glutamyl-gamma-aminobutyrate hydrolase family protein [Holosporales bacterium]|jgi:putative glutamine amidotransferase|nr:gamma-glutamyl-gamma-aminobutyrate hydrolase family protein [Holosporales bacterium]
MRALITQQQYLNDHNEPCDLLESSYIRFLQDLELKLSIQSNFLPLELESERPDLIIFPGGGNIDSRYMESCHDYCIQDLRDNIEKQLLCFATENEVPVLAICRGMQHVNGLLGGRVSVLHGLRAPRINGIDHNVRHLNGIEITVNHFHNCGIYQRNLAKSLKVIGLDVENDLVEAYYTHRILGLQWHPERKFEDAKSQEMSTALVRDFVRNKGVLDESRYSGCRGWTSAQ